MCGGVRLSCASPGQLSLGLEATRMGYIKQLRAILNRPEPTPEPGITRPPPLIKCSHRGCPTTL